MEPTLREGDRLLLRLDEPALARLAVGDVAVVRHPQGHAVVKRVTALDRDDLTVESDNATEPGAWSGVVGRSDVRGVVRRRVWPRPGAVPPLL